MKPSVYNDATGVPVGQGQGEGERGTETYSQEVLRLRLRAERDGPDNVLVRKCVQSLARVAVPDLAGGVSFSRELALSQRSGWQGAGSRGKVGAARDGA